MTFLSALSRFYASTNCYKLSDNIDGMRMSAALTYLMPMRHRLNLTVRGRVHVQKILFAGTRAVGVEAESGGEVFTIAADRVVLSAGAIRSPQLLMLSGIGPQDQLQPLHIPIVRESPGVGQNLWNHLSAQISFKVKDGSSSRPMLMRCTLASITLRMDELSALWADSSHL